MPIPSNITDLSPVLAGNSNFPAGGESPIQGDDHLRQAYTFIRQVYDGAGAADDVRADLADPTLAANGAGMVAFNPALNYAVGSTGAKLKERVSVLDYGADPTGVADSTSAFNAALATNRVVYAPSGTYRVSLSPPTYSEIVGDGILRTNFVPLAGATYVVRYDATTVAKQWCRLEGVRIHNPNAVANCVGMQIKGNNVFSINDYLTLRRVHVNGFTRGIDVTGRMIGHFWEQVEVLNCVKGMVVSTDPVDLAFIFNHFVHCYWNQCQQEGLRIETISLINRFDTCNWQENNSLNVAGVAAFYVNSPRLMSLDNCYIENNGTGVPVDAINAKNNSVGLWVDSTSITQHLNIANCWTVGSGTEIVMTGPAFYAGHVHGTHFQPRANGFSLFTDFVLAALDSPPLKVDANCIFNGKVETTGTDLQDPVSFQQNSSVYYYASANGTPPVINLLWRAKYSINTNTTAMTISSLTNSKPGCELVIWNLGTASVTLDSAIMQTNVAKVIAGGGRARFTVAGYPSSGKLLEV